MATFTAGLIGADFDHLDLGLLTLGVVQNPGPTSFDVVIGAEVTHLFGSGFTYGGGFPVSGTIDHIRDDLSGTLAFDLSGFSVPATTLLSWAATGAAETAKATILAAADTLEGSGFADLMRGYGGDDTTHGQAGNDYLDGGAGDDDVFGDDGNDTLVDSAGANFLRGGNGDDWLIGGADFDDLHGNIGDDRVEGGGFDDWVVGGQGNDMLFGDDGGDLCYGNLGADTVDGGAGADGVVGGQGNDVLFGGAGDDFIITGDRGDDTVSGGSGADTFRTFNQTGLDRVMDFNAGEGDRVLVDAGSPYTLSQVGADTVIDMGGGNRMILVGVQLSSLPAGWIVGG
jgi:Ca2+-binding RTX toxin-like protein